MSPISEPQILRHPEISKQRACDHPWVFEGFGMTLAAVKPALVRLVEWQIDQELERTDQQQETAQ